MIENYYTDIIRVLREVKTADDAGSFISTFPIVIASQYAKIIPITGSETTESQKAGYKCTHRLLTESSDIRMDDYIICRGKYYKVSYAHNPFNSNRFIRCDLVEDSNMENIVNA